MKTNLNANDLKEIVKQRIAGATPREIATFFKTSRQLINYHLRPSKSVTLAGIEVPESIRYKPCQTQEERSERCRHSGRAGGMALSCTTYDQLRKAHELKVEKNMSDRNISLATGMSYQSVRHHLSGSPSLLLALKSPLKSHESKS